jgi:hypothetical protein
MRFFARLFGLTSKAAIPGLGRVPAGWRHVHAACAQCGKALHAVKGGIVSGPGDQMIEYMLQKPLFCPRCRKTYCASCSFGPDNFVCPDCGSMIELV